MNQRIKELALQAKLRSPLLLQHYGNVDALTDSEQEELAQMEKFAELIIKDVTNMLPDDSIRDKDGVHMYYVIRDRYGVNPYRGV
jgi:hypothetical protein